MMFLLGLCLRLTASGFAYRQLLDPQKDYWEFGWETGRIAHAIVSGHGFASPLFGVEGSTAWMGPVYPLLLAAVFRVLGTFTAASAIAILGLNSLFSAATCVPIYWIAARVFGKGTARWSGWAWAVYPYAIYFASARVWETSLTTLLLGLAIWLTFLLADRAGLRLWLLYGALWALTALTNPATLILLPPLMAWAACRIYGRADVTAFLFPATAAGLIFVVFVSPWFVRNYRTFHQFIPFRDNFWLEFRMGNTGDTSDVYIDWAHPAHSSAELQEYRVLGEPGYFQKKKGQALGFVRNYPGMFMWLTVRRIVFTWTGFWTFRKQYLANEPFAIPHILVNTPLLILMLIGMRHAWHHRGPEVLPLVLCVATFPMLYYVTHSDPSYRHPIDPEIVMFAVYGLRQERTDSRSNM